MWAADLGNGDFDGAYLVLPVSASIPRSTDHSQRTLCVGETVLPAGLATIDLCTAMIGYPMQSSSPATALPVPAHESGCCAHALSASESRPPTAG